jgi:hypothetical protein
MSSVIWTPDSQSELKPHSFTRYPGTSTNKLNDDLLETFVEEYKNDIAFPNNLPQELYRWRNNVRNNSVLE